MPTVRMPDGTEVRFPDDMPKEKIRSLIEQKFPETRTARVRQDYDAMPWYGKAAQAVGDVARLGLNGATFNGADLLMGAVDPFNTADDYRRETADARARAGLAGTASEVIGSGLSGYGLASRGITAASALPQALRGGGGLVGAGARTAAMGVDGAAMGAASAAMGGGDMEDVKSGATWGGVGGAAGGALAEAIAPVISGVGRVFNPPRAPSVNEVRDMARQLYQQADNLNNSVTVTPQMATPFYNAINQDLLDATFSARTHPKVMTALRKMERELAPTNGGMRPKYLKSLESTFGKLSAEVTKEGIPTADAMLAGRIAARIDQFGQSDPNLARIMGLYKQADSTWGRFVNARRVDNKLRNAEYQRSSTYTGTNADNASRQRIKDILQDEKARRFYTPEQIRLMERFVGGDTSRNVMRFISKRMRDPAVWAMAGGAGYVINPALALVPAAGLAAEGIDTLLTHIKRQDLSAAMRAGSQAAATPPPNALQRVAQPEGKALLARLLASMSMAGMGVGPTASGQ